MKAGAVDFLTKPFDAHQLFAAVDKAIRRDAEQRLERAVRDSIDARIMRLTQRERQVMTGVIRGLLNKQIAAELGPGEKTIKVHRARVMAKLRVRSVAELVQLAAKAGVTHEFAITTPNHEHSAHMQRTRKAHAFRSTGADYALTDVDSAYTGADYALTDVDSA